MSLSPTHPPEKNCTCMAIKKAATQKSKSTSSPSKTNKTNGRKKVKWEKPKADTTKEESLQSDFFSSDGTIEVTLKLPAGIPITIGKAKGETETKIQEISTIDALRKLASSSKEELRAAMNSAKLQSQQLIGLCTVMHGNLYHLAAIGAKVTGRNK